MLWYQLTIEQQLNVLCDQLSKGAAARGIHSRLQRRGQQRSYLQVLPREDIALFDKGGKHTSNIAKTGRYNEARHEANKLLVCSQKWTEEQFEEVKWDWLDAMMENKADMYKVLLSKKHTGHCSTKF